MAHHDIKVIRRDDKVFLQPNPLPIMKTRDTVTYSSLDEGKVTIFFKKGRSPFREKNEENGAPMLIVHGGARVTVLNKNEGDGPFECGCQITLGWDPDNPGAHPEAGGMHDVPD